MAKPCGRQSGLLSYLWYSYTYFRPLLHQEGRFSWNENCCQTIYVLSNKAIFIKIVSGSAEVPWHRWHHRKKLIELHETRTIKQSFLPHCVTPSNLFLNWLIPHRDINLVPDLDLPNTGQITVWRKISQQCVSSTRLFPIAFEPKWMESCSI